MHRGSAYFPCVVFGFIDRPVLTSISSQPMLPSPKRWVARSCRQSLLKHRALAVPECSKYGFFHHLSHSYLHDVCPWKIICESCRSKASSCCQARKSCHGCENMTLSLFPWPQRPQLWHEEFFLARPTLPRRVLISTS